MSSRYVEIPVERLIGHLDALGAKVPFAIWELSGKERVWRMSTVRSAPPFPEVLVYTTIPVKSDRIRERAKDSVKIIVGVRVAPQVFRRVGKTRRVIRTAPAGYSHDERVTEFLDRLTRYLREAYLEAKAFPSCFKCSGYLVPREGKYGRFMGCSQYPTCKSIAKYSNKRVLNPVGGT